MAIFTQLAADNFQRANENPLSNGGLWSRLGATATCQVGSNAVFCTAANAANFNVWNNGSWPNGQYTQLTVVSLDSGGAAGINLCLRTPANGVLFNGYQFTARTVTGSFISRRDNGVNTTLVSNVSLFPVAGDIWMSTTIGTTLALYRNGVQVLQTTDATYVSGNPAIGVFNASASIGNTTANNWIGGSVVAEVVSGTVISCAPVVGVDNTWEVIYTYPLDSGNGRIGEALIFVGPNQSIAQWPSLGSTITVLSSPGTANQISLAIPDIVKWATFGAGTFGGTHGFPSYFIS